MKHHVSSLSLNLPYDSNTNSQRIKTDQLLGFKSSKHAKENSDQKSELHKSKHRINKLSFTSLASIERIKEKVLEKTDSKSKSSINSRGPKTNEKDIDKSSLSKRYEKIERISETYKNNADFLNLIEIIESQKLRISKLESQLDKRKKCKPDKSEKVISSLKKDRSKLLEKISDYKKMFDNRDWEFLLNKVEESNAVISKLSKEKKHLKKELSLMKNSPVFEKFNGFMHNIFKIRNDVNSLLSTIQNLYHGTGIIFKSFMGVDMESFNQPTVQVSNDLDKIKRDLNKIFEVMSDIHADRCAESMCKTQ